MKIRIFVLIQSFRASYWFLPSIMTIAALILGAVMVWIDAGPGTDWLDGIGWYQKVKPEGAREVLSTIAGSMITVAGVAFSITIVAIAYASSQYGPRILTNFMSDRGNQLTLGTFISTYVYCLVVLRTIQAGDAVFVPQLAVIVALLLALCSVAVLIYFIHHVPRSIHVNSVIAGVGNQLIRSIGREFPAGLGDPLDERHETPESRGREADERFERGDGVVELRAERNGYIQAMDNERLMETACKNGFIVCLKRHPGEFVYNGQTLALAWPSEKVDDDCADHLLRSYSIGSQRTPTQDLTFLIDELVEFAARALSTGVNDPYTAISCADWLAAGAAEMARRDPPSPYRLDKKGEVRVIASPLSFSEQIARGFGRMRPYVARDKNAAVHQLSTFTSLAQDCMRKDQLDCLAEEVEKLVAMSRTLLEGPALDDVEDEAALARRALADACQRVGQRERSPAF
jgi:uncharacterized membrane protein